MKKNSIVALVFSILFLIAGVVLLTVSVQTATSGYSYSISDSFGRYSYRILYHGTNGYHQGLYASLMVLGATSFISGMILLSLSVLLAKIESKPIAHCHRHDAHKQAVDAEVEDVTPKCGCQDCPDDGEDGKID